MKFIYLKNNLQLFLLGIIMVTACSKEYEMASTPYSEITSFKIPYNSGKDTIVAAVDGDNIYISWPGTTEWPIPETVTPLITTSKNASISPASGTSVSLKDGLQYQVKAQDGSVKSYAIKLSNGAILPSFADEESVLTSTVGGRYSIALFNLAADGSDSLNLVNDQNKIFKLMNINKINAGPIEFVADQYDGSGIPAGDYYVQIINKYRTPIRSNKKLITISADEALPYVFLNHTDTLTIKAGQTLSLPIRHLKKDTQISRVRIRYINESGYISSLTVTYLGMTSDMKNINIQIPTSLPGHIYSALGGGISIQVLKDDFPQTTFSPYHQYPIKIVD